MSLHSSTIQVTYDFICPWCWIGEENLERALAASGFPTDHPIHFLPYQLNPDMPVRGMDRKGLSLWQIRQLGAQPGHGRAGHPRR
jgi:predicted DsbA family dithiol-disulfide isomerase